MVDCKPLNEGMNGEFQAVVTLGVKGHLQSQHSQIHPDLLEGHKLPGVLVFSFIYHPIGALSDLLYFLEHLHV